MSSFFNQVGQFSQNLGSHVGQLSQNLSNTLGNSVNQLQQGLNTSIVQLNEELRVGGHTVLVKEKIAEGGFGLIVLVTDVHTQREMVLKRCNVDRPEVFQVVKKEISILQRFKGTYITQLIESDIAAVSNRPDSREALLLLEYYPGGHLLDRLNSRHGNYLPSESAYRIFGQILMGLKAFHENNPPIIHRDLKLENILFGLDGKVRLCDFGSCEESPIYVRNPSEREKAEDSIQKETTQMYRAPEMINLYMRELLTEKTDIWALGCIFFSLLFLKHPFQDVGSLAILQAKYTIPAQSTAAPDAIEFLHRMLDIDPEARASIPELLKALVEIAAGRPIPPYELSVEALRRRQERIAADQLRESKNKKKAAPVAPVRKGAPPSLSSVAAKRLAAKRGQPIAETNQDTNNLDFGDSSSSFEPFAEFGGSSGPTTPTPSGNIRPPSTDLFGNRAANTVPTHTDFFENDSSSFTSHSAPTTTVGFDPFDEQPAHQTQPNSTPAFDAFGGDDFFGGNTSQPDLGASQSKAKKEVRRPSFEEFTSSPRVPKAKPPAAPAPVEPSFSGFEDFDNTPVDFGSSSTTNDFDPFSSHTSVPAVPVPPPAAADFLFDSTENDFTPQQPPNTRQNSTSTSSFVTSDFNGFDFSLPQAPPSRQNSIARGGTTSDFGFDSFSNHPAAVHKPPAPADPFGTDTLLLTPTVAAGAAPTSQTQSRSAASGGNDLLGDLIETTFPSNSNQQRKSVNLRDPMELLSLYEQPKPEPPKPSVMLNNSSAISSLPFIPPNNPYGAGVPQKPPMRAPPPNPFANNYPPPQTRPPGVPPSPYGQPYGGGNMLPPMGGGVGGGGIYGQGAIPPGGAGGYGSYPPNTNPAAGNYSSKPGNNPNAMKPSYGVNSDPFGSLNVLNNNKR